MHFDSQRPPSGSPSRVPAGAASPGQRPSNRRNSGAIAISMPPMASVPAPANTRQIWVTGVLVLTAFWCVLSLVTLASIGQRLPSETSEERELRDSFVQDFSNSNNSQTEHIHMPFSDAALTHKKRLTLPGPDLRNITTAKLTSAPLS